MSTLFSFSRKYGTTLTIIEDYARVDPNKINLSTYKNYDVASLHYDARSYFLE